MKNLKNNMIKKKNNLIFFLTYLHIFSHFLNLFRRHDIFLINSGFFFQKNSILSKKVCNLKLFSYCNLCDYYSSQNFFNFEMVNYYSLIIIKENLKLDFIAKTTDLVLQKLFVKILSNPKFTKNSLHLKKFSQCSIFIFYKWSILLNFDLFATFSSEKILSTNSQGDTIKFQKFILKKKLLDIEKIKREIINSLPFKSLNSISDLQYFLYYISIKSDTFFVYSIEEFFKIYEIFKLKFFFISRSFFTLILNHISTKPFLRFIRIYYFIPDSFILEKITIFSLTNVSKKLLNTYVPTNLASISRGFVIRSIKIFKLNGIINSIIMKKLEPSRNDILEKIKKQYIILNHLNLFYFENYKKFLKLQSTKDIKKLVLLVQKINLIFFDENLNCSEFKMYLCFLMLFLIFLKKNLLPELKILIISWNSKKMLVNSVGLYLNTPKKFFSVCLSVLEFNLATHSLHETVFVSNVNFFKKRFKNYLSTNRRNQFLDHKKKCSILKNLKKTFFQKDTKTMWVVSGDNLKTHEREKIKSYRFVGSISNIQSFLEIKYFSNIRIKKLFTQSLLSISFFSKIYSTSAFLNSITTFFSSKEKKVYKNKKSPGLCVRFYSTKKKSKKLVFGICLLCFIKKRKKIKDFFKILFRNFLNLENLQLTFYSRFSICFQGFKSLGKKIGSFYLDVVNKNTDLVFFSSRKQDLLFFIKFLRNKKLFCQKLLRILNFKKNINFTSSFIQNLFFFSMNIFNISFKQSAIRFIYLINSFKNTISINFSVIIYPIVEYFYQKKKSWFRKLDLSV